MPIITISRGSYSKGKEIAEKVAERLGYECFSREVLIEASEHFNIPEIKLVRSLHDSPSLLERFTFGKERYVTYITEAFLEHVKRDNVVYHGLAGHFFLEGVDHNLKVRIIADLEDRVREEMAREGLSEKEARATILKDDNERRRWSQSLYGVDTTKASLYDLVIHIQKITADEAVDIICQTAQRPHFTATPQSQSVLEEFLLAAKVKAAVFRVWPSVTVKAQGQDIFIKAEGPLQQEPTIRERITKAAKSVPGVEQVYVSVSPTYT